MRPAILLPLLLLLAACHTQSGQALEAALQRRSQGIAKHLNRAQVTSSVSRSISRAGDTARRLVGLGRRRAANLPLNAKRLLSDLRDRVDAAHGRSRSTLRRLWDRDRRAVGKLAGHRGELFEALSVQTMARDLRSAVANVPNVLRTNRYILSGPGDPDRSTNPLKTTRDETWMQRILMRVRL